VSVDDALALADEHLGDLPYRQLFVDDEHSGRHFERSLRAAGWRTERDVVMALVRTPDRDVDTAVVAEADQQPMLALMRRWFLDSPTVPTSEALAELVEYAERETRARDDRRFGVLGDGGALVAMTKLRSDGAIAQIEDVYTVPEARRRGYARALVTRAATQARSEAHELVFVVADDNDWPKRLYQKLGFDPIGYAWAFHKGP
jgi:predicted GNAT family acetyltransferase